ncbi:MAG: hypothetical protein JWO79_3068 [Actinomycetia bacterium]|nr:hypothetical protein [Actinomycetes bacterium]
MDFRRSALAKREVPDDLTAPVRLTPARSWIALATLGAVVAAGVLWGFLGETTVSTDAPGVLSFVRGSFGVQSPGAGQVARVTVSPGDQLKPGAVVAEIVVGGRAVALRTVSGGRVAAIVTQAGQFVAAGAVVCVVERTGTPDDRLVAVLYLPVRSGSPAVPGAAVDLAVDTAPVGSYGLLRGTVTAVEASPDGRAQIAGFVGDDELAGELAADGPARRVTVDLAPDPRTASGYAWTNHSGPPFRLTSRIGVRGTIQQPPVRPVDWIIP